MKPLSLIALFCLMLVTGVFWGTWFTLTRSLEEFQFPEFIHIGKVIIANVAWPMRFLMPATILLMYWVTWQHRANRNAAFYCGVAACVLVTIVLIVTLLVLVPIDNLIRDFNADTTTGDWTQLRETWDCFHTLRTFLSMSAFAFFSAMVVYNLSRVKRK